MTIEINNNNRNDIKWVAKIVGAVAVIGGLYDLNIVAIIIGLLVINYSTLNKTLELQKNYCIFKYKSFLFNDLQHYDLQSVSEADVFMNNGQATIFLVKGDLSKKIIVKSEDIDRITKHLKDVCNIEINLGGKLSKLNNKPS